MIRLLTLMLILPAFLFSEEARILRYPNASETHITFCHSGDLFVVPIEGGLARRITTHPGEEMYPRISPDGKTIAFTGLYDGNREIYTVPLMGGAPQRVTYSMDQGNPAERMGPDKIIMQWQDNEHIVYRSRKDHWQIFSGHLYSSDINGGLPYQFPIGTSGYASLSPDGSKIAYNRIFREYRTWKRYRGGQADDIWIFDLKTKELKNITDHPAQDIIPMWVGNKVYFQSDRTGIMNIYSYDLTSNELKAVTNFTNYDVKFASKGANSIAFSQAGYIHIIDTNTDQVRKVSVEILEDFPHARNEIVSVKDRIGSAAISPDGKRTVIAARGEIFTVPEKHGNIRQLRNTSGVHERNVTWSPNGEWIAYVSDETGEDEIFLERPDGSERLQLTNDAQSYRYNMKWSPDSKKIIASDKSLRLYYIDIDTKKTKVIRKSKQFEITDYSWSPDSKWITFTDYVVNYQPVVYLYNLESKKTTQVTSEFFQSYNPVFTPGGSYLLFVSDRTFKASIGSFEWNFSYSDMSKIYGVTLRDELKSPFDFKSDEVDWKKEASEGEEKEEKAEEEKDLVVELDGIMDRIFEVPVDAANYGSLYPSKDHKLFYTKFKDSDVGTYCYDFVKQKETKAGDFTNWEVSANGKKILLSKGSNWYVEDFNTNVLPIKPNNSLDLNDLKTELNRQEEWSQIYYEGWRQMKYFFYDPNMHGVDWEAVKKKYEVMLPHIKHRVDLTYVMGEMIGELNVGHAYVGGGEQPEVADVNIGLLGAEFSTHSSGFYKIDKIFEGRNWEEKTRSPLTEPGFEVNEGDYILEIDGKKLTKNFTPYMALVDKVRDYVTIKVNSKPSMDGARELVVKTTGSETGLRYFKWVEENRKKVEKATDGKIGYIHIPDMGVGNGLNEFVKYFYPQARKEGLIIDDRYNGGGNVSPMIIERLRREISIAGIYRNQETVTAKPNGTMTGPIVCLINELSMSDGDLFPYQFKAYNIGTLIGKRSWGGVIGIRGSLPFLDGGYMMKPEAANFGANGEWILEGVGMEPDIEIDNHPARLLDGIDDQLNKAIEVVLEQLKTDKKTDIPPIPQYPDKTKPRDLR